MNLFKKLFFISLITASCATIDVNRQVKTDAGIGKQDALPGAVTAVPIETPPEVITQPIYIPDKSPLPPRPKTNEVMENMQKGVLTPKDYSHAAILYDYDSDWVYEVYCQPLHVSDIWLRPGEQTVEAPFIADSERWMLGAGVSYENGTQVQHIYVKPTEANIQASLIINTNQRVYHIILRSYSNRHMPKVRFRYHDKEMPQNYLQDAKQKSTYVSVPSNEENANMADPRFLSFNYTITYSRFRKPRWLPSLAYDDGKKTYITFPEDALQAELPGAFEKRGDIINYRVARNVIIIDKLLEVIMIKIGKYTVTIKKKKGR